MPFYEYQCRSCGAEIEVLQKINDKPLRKCTSCGKTALVKLVSAPVFRLKGSGWYETDFKSEQDKKRNLAGSEADDKPQGDNKGDKPGDSKSDGKDEKSAASAASDSAAASKAETKADTQSGSKAGTKAGADAGSGSKPAAKASRSGAAKKTVKASPRPRTAKARKAK